MLPTERRSKDNDQISKFIVPLLKSGLHKHSLQNNFKGDYLFIKLTDLKTKCGKDPV